MVSQAQSQHEASKSQEDTICTMFYYPQKTPNKPEGEDRYCQYYGSHSEQLVIVSNGSSNLHFSKDEIRLCVNELHSDQADDDCIRYLVTVPDGVS